MGGLPFRLWEEYAETHGDQALSYSRCARVFSRHRGARATSLRQTHEPGRAVFVDYSGDRPAYTDRATGERVPVELFVGVLGASSLVFACCTATQTIPDWVDAHVRMVEFFGGVPLTVVPDNLKSAITKAGREPTIQRTYLEWARHYGTAILPARPGQPRDKGIVEGAVLIAQRQFLPELAKHTYFSLEQINEAIAALLVRLNAKAFQKRIGSRSSEFERMERSALLPLPAKRYEYQQWVAKQTVPSDYHVAVHGHFYSVPHSLVGQRAEARVSPSLVDIFCDGQQVARHARQSAKGQHTTASDHQPEAHRSQGERRPEHLLDWASQVGPDMRQVMEKQFRQKVPLQGIPAALSLRNMEKSASPDELERAAGLALGRRMANPTGVRRFLRAATNADPFPTARKRVGLHTSRRAKSTPPPIQRMRP